MTDDARRQANARRRIRRRLERDNAEAAFTARVLTVFKEMMDHIQQYDPRAPMPGASIRIRTP
jgi:hypothetical protein